MKLTDAEQAYLLKQPDVANTLARFNKAQAMQSADSDTRMAYLQRVRRLRKEAGLLQCELAIKAHCTQHTIGHIESDRGGCNMFTFIELGRAFGVSLDYLATGVNHGNDQG